MKYLVAYWSQTGNTKKVAEAIFMVLPGEKFIKTLDEVGTLDGFDLIFIGFPVMQFGPPPAVKKFLSDQVAGKKIALFVTHAMLSNTEDPRQQAILHKELEKCRSACSGSQLAGLFHCQGELSETVANELLSSHLPMLMEFAAMRPDTIGHPDQAELEEAEKFAMSVIAR
ncbi:MAG: flavodoxin [Bacteroidetes bacterium]|nr:flavodoxin [Bacteroidota bacterium]